MTARLPLNNKVKNGYFNNIPPFTAVQTSGNRWIDGTAAGSLTNSTYGWYAITGIAGMEYSIRDGSIKIEATTTAARGRVMGSGTESTTTLPILQQNAIPMKPNTSYTITYKYKATNALASAIGLLMLQFRGDGTVSTTISDAKIPAGDTNNWTSRTFTFTTASDIAFGSPYIGIFSAGNISAVYFSEIKLDTTVPSIRTVAINRLVTRDMGTALKFDGSGSMSIPTINAAIYDTSKPITFTAWINYPAAQGLNDRGIIDKWVQNTGVNRTGMRLTLTSNGNLSLRNGIGAASDTGDILTSDSFVPTKQWTFVAGIFDGTNLTIFVNGTKKTMVATVAASNLSNTLTIGDTHHSNGKLVGSIDEPRIWNRALSDAEIIDLCFKNVVPRNGLIGEWLLNEGSGTTPIDSSATNNPSSFTGATYVPSYLKPRVVTRSMGTALKFDGTTQQVTTPYLVPNSAQSFSGWAYRSNRAANHSMVGTNNGANGLRINIGSGVNDIRFQSNQASGAGGGVVFTNAARLNEFFNWVVTYDLTTTKLYINGVLFGALPYIEAFLAGQAFVIGKYGAGGAEFFNGVLDNIRVHDRVLTAQEVSDMYFQGIIPRNGLKVEYLFDEGSGTITNDSSGNGNTGTITGATFTTFTPLKQRTIA